MKQAIFGIIIVSTLAIIGFSVINTNNSIQNSNQAINPEESQTSYTASEVSIHNNEDDCWTIVRGKVYDITSYIPRHSREEISLACGIDATSLFENRKTDNGQVVGSGEPHSSSAILQLSSLQIGTLSAE